VAYVRTVRTTSGATAVQVVWSSRRGSRRIDHLGSAHSDDEVAALRLIAAERIAAGQGELDLELAAGSGPLEVVGSRAGHLWDALCRAYDSLGFDEATGGDEVFRALVLARIIEPTSKLDALRVLDEAGVAALSYATLKRRLPRYGNPLWRKDISAACAAHAALGPASLVLYDVSTLYFETDAGDGFREPGFSKERRLEPQITIGLLTDAGGFPLAVEAFEGNKAETATMVPTLRAFMTAHRLTDITVVADAGMLSEANKREIEAAGLGFILGNRIGHIPYALIEWRDQNPDVEVPDGLTLTQPWPGGPTSTRRDQVIYYQYRADRARRTLRGIDEQVGKAEKAVAGKVPVKRNRFITLAGGDKSVNRELEAKARTLARLEELHHQHHQPERGVRDRRLPPTLAHREELPHVQARPASPPDLPPQTRINPGPPRGRVHRPGRHPPHRDCDRLVDQALRADRPPLPHHRHPGRHRRPDR
jgi:hypothetical protein